MNALKSVSRFCAPILLLSVSSTLRYQSAGQSEPMDNDQVRSVVTSFFDAFQRRDLEALMRIWSVKSPDFASARQAFEQQFGAIDKVHLDAVQVRGVEINKDHATVLVSADLSAVDVQTGKSASGVGKLNRLVELVKEGGAWKIVRYVSAEEDLANRIAAAKTEDERNALVDANPDLATVELERSLVTVARQVSQQSGYHAALDVLRLAEHLATRFDDKAGLAAVLKSTGDRQIEGGEFEQAVDSLQKSRTICEALGNKMGIAGALNDAGNAYRELGDYAMALRNFQQALDFVREIDDKRRIAAVLNNIGLVEQRQSDYAAALRHYQESLDIEEQSGDMENLAKTILNMGIVVSDQGNYEQALVLYRKSLKIATEAGQQHLVCLVLQNIAVIEDFLGNHVQAIENSKESLGMAEKLGDKLTMAAALDGIGSVEAEDGNYVQAELNLERGLEIARSIGSKELVAVGLNDIGSAQRGQGQYRGALQHFEEALKVELELSDRANSTATLNEIALTHIALGEYPQATEAAERSAQQAEQIGFRSYRVDALVILAKAYRAMGKIEEAHAALAKAISMLEDLRGRVGEGEVVRERFLERQVAPYYAMADLLLDQSHVLEAFSFAEQSKARILMEVLESGKVNVTKGMTPEDRVREHEVNARLASVNEMLLREKLRDRPDPKRLAALESALVKARRDQESLQDDLYAAHPRVKTQRGQFQALSLSQCSELIPDAHTALIEFLVSEGRTDIFVLSKPDSTDSPKLTTHKIDLSQTDLTKTVEQFRQRLARRDPTFEESSVRLYDLLIRPLAAELAGKTHLIIVPDAILWELPFQSLGSSRNRFLIEDYAVSYAPSLKALREMYLLRSRATRQGFVAFANPLLSQETAMQIKDTFMGSKLQPLPQAETQARMLANMWGPGRSKIYIGPEATEDRLKAEAGPYHELYIAAHGIANNASPMYSQIVLSQAKGSDDDGVLEAWEVVNMNVDVDLVVLSACDTAGGRVGPGEGMIGLSWAFFIAGCPATVASQWDVDADATTQLMVEFHRAMLAGRSKADALRLAELGLLRGKKYSDPFYWAPFIVVGDGR